MDDKSEQPNVFVGLDHDKAEMEQIQDASRRLKERVEPMTTKDETAEKVTFTYVNTPYMVGYKCDLPLNQSGAYVPLSAFEAVREECEALRADWLTEQRWHQEAADKAAHLTDALAAKTAECEGLRAVLQEFVEEGAHMDMDGLHNVICHYCQTFYEEPHTDDCLLTKAAAALGGGNANNLRRS
jgi:hypothetical protein